MSMNTICENSSNMFDILFDRGGHALTAKYVIHQYWEEEGDPRTIHFPLFGDGPTKMLAIMASYLLFVLVIGPKFMKNREPFVLRRPMLIYNTLMVVINLYAFYETVIHINYGREFLNYEFPRKTDFSYKTIRLINLGYFYYLSKFFDLFDTILFVLRKKTNQITFLHLYHHTAVPILGWLAMKLAPMAPPLFMFVLLNSFVHIVMYSYYALAAFGPKIQKYLWWKKYITQLQLLQFIAFIGYGITLARFQTGYPPIWFWIGFSQNPLFFFLFFDFYMNAYKRKTKKVE